MDPAIDIKGLLQVGVAKGLTRESSRGIGLVGIHSTDNTLEPVAWVMSAEYKDAMEAEKKNLIKAKVRAIIGTAVFGAGLAIAIGVVIGVCHKKQH